MFGFIFGSDSKKHTKTSNVKTRMDGRTVAEMKMSNEEVVARLAVERARGQLASEPSDAVAEVNLTDMCDEIEVIHLRVLFDLVSIAPEEGLRANIGGITPGVPLLSFTKL